MNMNELTRRLLAEGYKPEDTPPGMNPYREFDGGWTYDNSTLGHMVFETPCGLLVQGWSFSGGHMSYRGVDWTPENNNPTVCCPRFTKEPCPLLHPLLRECPSGCRTDDIARTCACHKTDRPYTFDESVDAVHEQVWREADERWELYKAANKGRVCKQQSVYGRTTKTWRTIYSPMDCATWGGRCQYCDVLAKELDTRKGNVFYDVRKSWIEKGTGFLPDRQRVAVEKGVKLLRKTASMTICEAIVKYARHEVEDRIKSRYHRELYFDHTLQIEVENLRAERRETRDIFRDLQDVENGIEVVHEADKLRAAKAQKKERKEAREAQKTRKMEKLILERGWGGLDNFQRMRAEKLLGMDYIEALLRKQSAEKQAKEEEKQLSLFQENEG